MNHCVLESFSMSDHGKHFGLQNQDVVPISSYDTAGSFLILGCNNGSIYYIGKSEF